MKSKLPKEELKRRAQLVAENMNGVQSIHLPFYTLSLAYPVKQGMAAFRRYEASKAINRDPDFMFSAAQEGINNAASVSRFLWPAGRSKLGTEGKSLLEARGKRLRETFDIPNNSALNNRALRNAFEHFDERLDFYLLEDHSGYFFPNAMLESHSLADESIGNIFKLIDPDSDCIVLFNEKFFFKSVIDSLEALERRLSKHTN